MERMQTGRGKVHLSQIQDNDLKHYVFNQNSMNPASNDQFVEKWFGNPKKSDDEEVGDRGETDIDYELKNHDD